MNTVIEQSFPATVKRRTLRERWRRWTEVSPLSVSIFFALHVALGLVLSQSATLSALHAYGVLLVGVWLAATSPRLEGAVYAAAYLVGAETLWRMTRAPIFWEFCKYSIIVVLVVSLVRNGKLAARFAPFLYFFALLPSAVLPVVNISSDELSDQASFNLSGPLALTVCAWFFSHATFTPAQLQRVFFALIAPVISVASVTLAGILGASRVRFANNSNLVASGGFGPNQVSATLGLAAMLAFLGMLLVSSTKRMRLLLLALSIYFSIQSALTFSRTGLYIAAGAIVIASGQMFRSPQTRMKLAAAIGGLLLLTNFLLLPQLDSFTGGAISKRFSNTKLTGRDRIALADLQLWIDNPVFGVGPGQAKVQRQGLPYQAAAHTEFSRLLAEHGSFGLFAILVLLFVALQNYRNARTPGGRALVLALTSWSFLFMLGTAMRLAAPSFAFGLAAAAFLPEMIPPPAAQGSPERPPDVMRPNEPPDPARR
jgi:O-antigen ligase